MQLHVYKFNLIREDCRPFRKFEELFTKVVVDISNNKSKDTLKTIETMANISTQLEVIIMSRYSVNDFFFKKTRR